MTSFCFYAEVESESERWKREGVYRGEGAEAVYE